MATRIRPSQIAGIPLSKGVPILINTSTAQVTVSNTLTETTYYSYTIPGGLLGINDALMIKSWGSFEDNSTGTFLSSLKYGGTTVATTGATIVQTAATVFGYYNIYHLKNVGATNSQKGHVLWAEGAFENNGVGTAAIDSTVNQLIEVTAKWSTANATQIFTSYYTALFYLPNTV